MNFPYQISKVVNTHLRSCKLHSWSM